MRLIPTQSSNLSGIAYTPGSDRFYICFKGGSVYEYVCPSGGYVPPASGGFDPVEEARALVTDVLFAKSQGSAFNANVKGNSFLVHRKLEEQEIADLEMEV